MNTEKAHPRKVHHSYTNYKPVSMIPANGWRAVYAYRDENDDKYAHAKPLIAFVLAEERWMETYEGGRQETAYEGRCIVGYDSDYAGIISPANVATNFIAYLPPGTSIPDSMEQAAKEYVLDHLMISLGEVLQDPNADIERAQQPRRSEHHESP